MEEKIITALDRHVILGKVYDQDYGDYDVRNGDDADDINNSLYQLLRRFEGRLVRITFEVMKVSD